MDFSKITAFVLCYSVLFYSGVCGVCNINMTSFTAECSHQCLNKVPSDVPNSIEVLDLAYNYFHEVKLRQFKRFQNLEKIYLNMNYISHLIEEPDSELSTVRVLDISSNMLHYLNSAFFSSIPNLQNLSIRSNFLQVSMFKGLQNLTYLDMGFNKPIQFNSTPFTELNYLEDLDLSVCQLWLLRDTMFTGLTNLLKLNLSQNSIDYLPSGLFVRLTKLKVLDLSINPLHHSMSLPVDIFQPLTHLEELNLVFTYRGPLKNYTYMDEQLRRVPSLKQLYITAKPYKKFGPGFTALTNLENLHILGNLSEMNNETFYNLRYANSLKLTLEDCQISSILPNTFTTLKNLTLLDVSWNTFLCKPNMWINFTTGICKSRLKILIATHLPNCKYEYLAWWACDPPKLEVLDFSYNNIQSIGRIPVSLKELYLTGNQITSINLLENLYKLTKLDLSGQSTSVGSYTQLKQQFNTTSEDSNDQRGLLKLSSALLNNIDKTFVYSDNSKTGQNTELKSKHMKDRTLVHNSDVRFMRLPYMYIIPPFLEWLDVSESGLICDLFDFDNTNNSIKTLKSSAFKPVYWCTTEQMQSRLWQWLNNFKMLEDLYLNGNQISKIPVGAFTRTNNLKNLYLMHNSLVTLTFQIKHLVNLKEVHLSYNVIQYASIQFTTGIKSDNLTIYLDGNDLVCDCARSSFIHWLDTSNVVNDINELMCKYENGSQISLRHSSDIYQKLKYECIFVAVTISCVVIFLFLLFGGVAVGILSHKRWKVKYLSVVARHTVNPYHPLEECYIELEYDIYISYERDHDITENETLHTLVTQKLYPWFQRRGFKVLIRDELDIGRKLYEVISKALRKSRKVIIFLSNDYCLDYWNVFEFNVAATEGIYTKRQVIIPVAVEILNPDVFYEEIATFLKSVSYPRYTSTTDFIDLAEYLSEKVRS